MPTGIGTVLLHVLVVLVAAKVGAELSERLGQPAVLGELAFGVLIGPSALGLVGHDAVLAVLAELGVLLLLLEVGLETELTDLLRVGRTAFLVALVGVALPFAFAYVLLRATGLAAGPRHAALLVAATLTATSVGITARVFGDLKALSRTEARTVLGAAVIDDVIGLVILAVIVRVVGGGELAPARLTGILGLAVGFLAVGVLIGVRVAPPLFHWIERRARSDGTVIGLALAFALGFAQLAELAGLAPIVGAFVAGVVLARSRTRRRIGSSLAPIGHVFVPVFFLTIGIDADLGGFLHPRVLLLALLLLAVGAAGKVLAGLAASGTGMDRWLIGLGMLPRGEVGLIFASFGLRLGVIDQDVYGALLLVVLATTFVTPPLLRWRSARHGGLAAASQLAGPGQGSARELEVRGGVVELTDKLDKAPVGGRAALGLRAARLVAGARPGPRLVAWLEEGGTQPVVWSRPLTDELFALLRAGSSGSWDFLERTGLLARYLPEVARLREALADRQGGRPWDRLARLAHLLDSRRDAAAAAAWLALPAPDNLLLVGLVRAVGDGGETGRVRAAARRTAERLGLGATDQQAVALLVGAEADLGELAVRTDPQDEQQVLDIAARLGSPERARMAYLLALAEQADGQEWQGWRRALLDELLRLVLAAMAEPGLTDRAAENLVRRRRAEAERALNGAGPGAVAWLAAAPRRYLLAQPAEAIARHAPLAAPALRRGELRLAISPEPPDTPGAWTVDVVTLDQPGLLASLTGALSACGLDITRAQASTWPDGLVVDVFHVSGPTLEADPGFPARVEGTLRRAMAGDLATARVLAQPPDARGKPGPVVVRVDADASPWHSTVQVDAPDRPGLLYEILNELARHHAEVQVARVGGEAGRAVDVFFVTDAAGSPLDRAAADRLCIALGDHLTQATRSP